MSLALSDHHRQQLREASRAASRHAYAPYSHFPVGAAILCPDGQVFAGCNVENVSFGLTICAERNAIFQAVASGQRDFLAISVYTPTTIPTSPCGACRQVIHEFAPHAIVLCFCDSEETHEHRLEDLLPGAFEISSTHTA